MRSIVVLAILAGVQPALAQECHPLPAAAAPLVALRAGLALETAAIDDGLGRSGHYRGAVTSVELAALGARARISLGAYQVEWGQHGEGLGDLNLAVQRGVLTAGATELGLGMSATLPTGDVSDDLGMGHPMIMPAVWARWSGARSSLLGSLVYGSMLGSSHAHGMSGPIPSPMNAEEVAASVRVGRRFGRAELSTSISGALPIGDGASRGAVGAAARMLFGATELALDLSTPFGGTPIQARGVVEISRGF